MVLTVILFVFGIFAFNYILYLKYEHDKLTNSIQLINERVDVLEKEASEQGIIKLKAENEALRIQINDLKSQPLCPKKTKKSKTPCVAKKLKYNTQSIKGNKGYITQDGKPTLN